MGIMYELIDTVAVIIEVTMCFVFVSTFIGENVVKEHFIGIVITNIIDIIFNYITVQIMVYSILKYIIFIGIILCAQLRL